MFRKLPGDEDVLTRKQNWITWAIALVFAIIVLVTTKQLWAALLTFIGLGAIVRLTVAVRNKQF